MSNIDESAEEGLETPAAGTSAPAVVGKRNLAQNLNLATIVLAFVGVFISGVLSFAHWKLLVPPCLSDDVSECTAVIFSKYGYMFGVPVAYYGLVGYLVLLGLGLARVLSVGRRWSRLALVSGFLTFVFAIYSVYLQIISLNELGAKCAWCIASALTMTVTFLVTAYMAQQKPPTEPGTIKVDMTWSMAAAVVSMGLVGWQAGSMQAALPAGSEDIQVKGKQMSDLLPIDAKVRGKADARVAVLEFADVNCGSCRAQSPMMHKIYDKYNGRLKWAYRHYPLYTITGHETSLLAGFIMEFAASKGKFWEYLDTSFSQANEGRVKSEEGLYAIASEVGLDVEELKTAFKEETEMQDGPYLNSLTEDFSLAMNTLKVTGTPTFILIAEGRDPEVVSIANLESVLKRGEYASLLK